MRVILKSTGQLGDIPDDKFDPSLFQKAGTPASTPAQPQGNLASGVGNFLTNLLIPATKKFTGDVTQQIQGLQSTAQANPQLAGKNALDLANKYSRNASSPLDLIMNLVKGQKEAKSIVKPAAEIASFGVPFGEGGNILSKILAPGAAVGALSGISKDKATPASVIGDTAMGAGGAAILQKIIPGAFEGVNKVATEELPERLMNSVFKEPIKDTKAAIKTGESLGKQALDRGIKGMNSQSIFRQTSGKINELEDSLQTALSSSKRIIPIADIRTKVAPLIKKYADAGNKPAVDNITTRIDSLEQQHGKSIPVAIANEIKRTMYEEVKNGYGKLASENTEGVKAIARALKENIAKKVLGADEINKELSVQGRLRDSILDKLSKEERSSLIGLTDLALGGTGTMAFGPAGLAAVAAKKVLGSTGGKTNIANTLADIGKNASKVNFKNPVMQYLLGQTGSRVAVSAPEVIEQSSNQDGEPKYPAGQEGTYQTQDNKNNSSPIIENAHDNASIPQGNGDAILDASGQWKWDQQANDWVPNNQLTREKITQAMVADLANGGKNIPELKTILDTLPEDAKDKGLSASASQVLGKANAADAAIGRISDTLSKDPNKLFLMSIPGAPGARELEADYSSLADAIGGLRTGASVSPEQSKYYRNILPKLGDSQATIRNKLAAVKKELQFYINNGGNIKDPYQP